MGWLKEITKGGGKLQFQGDREIYKKPSRGHKHGWNVEQKGEEVFIQVKKRVKKQKSTPLQDGESKQDNVGARARRGHNGVACAPRWT